LINWLRVLVVESGKAPKVCELPDNLKAMELTVRGIIETIETVRPGCLIIYDGKNRLTKKPENRSEILGTFIIVRVEHPALVSLNDEDIEILSKIYG
jgi:hypothetical protein